MEFEEVQRLNLEELKAFREELIKENCAVCSKKPFGITRTCILCREHYKLLVKDNKLRITKEIDITDKLDFLVLNEIGTLVLANF